MMLQLKEMLPSVFADTADQHRDSGIWLNSDVTFRPGKRYLIKAASGQGKSSLCAYLYGKRNDYLGQLLIDGEDSSCFSKERWTTMRRDSIAYLPQELGLFPTLTAIENIRLKNNLTRCRTDNEIGNMMEILGIGGLADRPANRLSVGQQQRVAIVRALCQPFSLLLLDEPVSHLDAKANHDVATLIDEETKRTGATVIVTSVGNDLMLNDMEQIIL